MRDATAEPRAHYLLRTPLRSSLHFCEEPPAPSSLRSSLSGFTGLCSETLLKDILSAKECAAALATHLLDWHSYEAIHAINNRRLVFPVLHSAKVSTLLPYLSLFCAHPDKDVAPLSRTPRAHQRTRRPCISKLPVSFHVTDFRQVFMYTIFKPEEISLLYLPPFCLFCPPNTAPDLESLCLELQIRSESRKSQTKTELNPNILTLSLLTRSSTSTEEPLQDARLTAANSSRLEDVRHLWQ